MNARVWSDRTSCVPLCVQSDTRRRPASGQGSSCSEAATATSADRRPSTDTALDPIKGTGDFDVQHMRDALRDVRAAIVRSRAVSVPATSRRRTGSSLRQQGASVRLVLVAMPDACMGLFWDKCRTRPYAAPEMLDPFRGTYCGAKADMLSLAVYMSKVLQRKYSYPARQRRARTLPRLLAHGTWARYGATFVQQAAHE